MRNLRSIEFSLINSVPEEPVLTLVRLVEPRFSTKKFFSSGWTSIWASALGAIMETVSTVDSPSNISVGWTLAITFGDVSAALSMAETLDARTRLQSAIMQISENEPLDRAAWNARLIRIVFDCCIWILHIVSFPVWNFLRRSLWKQGRLSHDTFTSLFPIYPSSLALVGLLDVPVRRLFVDAQLAL